MDVRSVGYVGLDATDLFAWRDYAVDVLGVEPRADSGDDRLSLKTDAYSARVFIEGADRDGLSYLGLEMASESALASAVAELAAAGVAVRAGTDGEAADRGVGALAVLADPAGNRLELYVRPGIDYSFVSPHGARFVTGQTGELGFGHVVLVVGGAEYDSCRDFYTRVLGFGVSEYTTFGPVEITFMHCNPRHHSVALARGPGSVCHHIMLELESLDMVGMGLDRAEAAKIPITSSLGRHRNDEMVSFYMRSPNGVEVEFGWGARLIDPDNWSVSEWVGGDVWGHRGLDEVSL